MQSWTGKITIYHHKGRKKGIISIPKKISGQYEESFDATIYFDNDSKIINILNDYQEIIDDMEWILKLFRQYYGQNFMPTESEREKLNELGEKYVSKT